MARARHRDDLRFALEVACSFGRRLLVERAVEPMFEINCAVLGNDDPIPSVCEQPIATGEVLSFADKYVRGDKGAPLPPAPSPVRRGGEDGEGSDLHPSSARGGAGGRGAKGGGDTKRIIPAPIPAEMTRQIQALAVDAFRAIDGAGIARADFLVGADDGQVYVNELNTMPGSLAFYLWEPSGIPFPALIDRLVALALERHREQARNTYTYDTDLLERTLRGAKQ